MVSVAHCFARRRSGFVHRWLRFGLCCPSRSANCGCSSDSWNHLVWTFHSSICIGVRENDELLFVPFWGSLLFCSSCSCEKKRLVAHCMYDSSRSSTPIFPDIVHHFFGRIVSLLGIAVMFLGIFTLQKLYGLPTVAPYVLLALLCAASLVFYIVFLARAAGSSHSSSSGYNMGRGEDFSVSSSGSGSASKWIFAVAGIVSLCLFAGFVVTLYVPAISYSGSTTAFSGSLNGPNKACFRFDSYAVPAQLTSYTCRGFK